MLIKKILLLSTLLLEVKSTNAMMTSSDSSYELCNLTTTKPFTTNQKMVLDIIKDKLIFNIKRVILDDHELVHVLKDQNYFIDDTNLQKIYECLVDLKPSVKEDVELWEYYFMFIDCSKLCEGTYFAHNHTSRDIRQNFIANIKRVVNSDERLEATLIKLIIRIPTADMLLSQLYKQIHYTTPQQLFSALLNSKKFNDERLMNIYNGILHLKPTLEKDYMLKHAYYKFHNAFEHPDTRKSSSTSKSKKPL